jgi:4-alpha-glucanotransferase
MNLPGSEHGNWEWRFEARALTEANATALRELTRRSRRL